MEILDIIGKIFGNKYDKDVKNIMLVVDQINTIFEELQSLNNNQLRQKTQDLKDQISTTSHQKNKKKFHKLKIQAEKDISTILKRKNYMNI